METCYYGHDKYDEKYDSCPVCEHERNEGRKQADKLIELAERLGYSDSMKVASNCPNWLTIGHMRHYVEPTYSAEINNSIMIMTMRTSEVD